MKPMTMTDKMDEQTREYLMRKLGHEQYLILLAMATLDNMNTLKSYAALKHAESQAMAKRLATNPRTPTDQNYDEALGNAHLRASFATVTRAFEKLAAEADDADEMPVAPIRRSDAKKEIEEFAADVMEALTFSKVKKQWWLQ